MDTPEITLKDQNDTSLFGRGIRFLYSALIKPKSLDEDDSRKEFLLNVILLGSILSLTVLYITTAYHAITLGVEYKGLPLWAFTIIVLGFHSIFVISRMGYARYSAYLLVAVLFLSITYAMYHWGIDLPLSVLSFVLIIVISGITISTRFAIFMTGLISLVVYTLGYLETKHYIAPRIEWRMEPLQISDSIEVIVFYFLILLVSWLSNREIEKSLARARRSESDLRQERDLLEVKVEERTKELKRAQLEKMSQLYRFAEFGRLSSGVFHDLANPLTAASLNMEELQRGKDVSGQIKQQLKRMQDFILAVRKQIQNQEFQKTFSLISETHEVMQVLNFKAKKNNVNLKFTHPPALETYGNPLKFHQVVLNLLSNAIDSYENTPTNKNREVVITLVQIGNGVRLSVKDNGSGIAKENLQKIFDPFFTTKAAEKGTGIGLSNTKEIVERNFLGSIEVESTLGEGTTFIVNFPIQVYEPNRE